MKQFVVGFVFFVFIIIQTVCAQNNKIIVLKLKTGYSVKGELIEQTPEKIRIKTLSGETFEYRIDEIEGTQSTKVSTVINDIPLVVTKGDKLISLGVGLINNLEYDKLAFPNLPITFEYILNDDLLNNKLAFGLGGYFGYCVSKSIWDSESKNSKLLFGARGYIHYPIAPKLDTYGGILLGYKKITYRYEYSSISYKESSGSFTANLFIGGRYFFNDKFAGMAELGWGLSVFTIGVSVKL